jgi:23S rRNA pseudouridine2605 synthase
LGTLPSREPLAGERIQKLLAAAGVGSRRGIEEWLRAGRLSVNGQVAKLGDRATAGDRFELDGKPLQVALLAPGPGAQPAQAPAISVLIYHKPVGEVTTRHDPQGRPTVFERLPAPPAGRWVVVGRLDTNTSGLLLFTNDGALAHRLMHPSFEVERRYLVRVRGSPGPELEFRLLEGVMLEDGPARFAQVQPRGRSEGHAWYEVSLREGRNREVRRAFETAGYEVSRLKRLSYGPFVLPEELAAGKSLQLSAAQVAEQMARL